MEHYDVIVAGAGVSGICAAIQAGRGGARVLLVEKNGIPGGTMTMADVAVPGLFNAWGRQIISGIGWELVEKCLREEGRPLPDFTAKMEKAHWLYQVRINPFFFAVFSEEALQSAKVELAYHTMLGAARGEADGWRLTLCGKDGLYDVSGRIIIDCTGDANLTRMAGYEVVEPPEVQPGTSSARLLNIEHERLDAAELAAAYDAAAARGEIRYSDLGWFERKARQGEVHVLVREGENANHVCGINAADSPRRTRMEVEGRQALMRAYRFLKGHKGLERLGIRMSAAECGVRESRTILGEYVMTREDYAMGRTFEDAVCYGFYTIDVHKDDGLDCRALAEGTIPQIPMRIMLPRGGRNILAAGRIVSADHYASAALRIQATCMATGQAVGANALCALDKGCMTSQVSSADVRALLQRNGAIVP